MNYRQTLGRGGRKRRITATVVTVSAATLALAACSPLTAEPVPEEPQPPWLCDGVSGPAIEVVIGPGSLPMQSGDWRTLKETGFECRLDNVNGTIDIVVTPFGEGQDAASKAAATVEAWRGAGGEAILDAPGIPGQGYAFGENGVVVTAGWVCTDRSVEVILSDVWLTDQRDQRADAKALLMHVAPYACAQMRVPGVDYSPSD